MAKGQVGRAIATFGHPDHGPIRRLDCGEVVRVHVADHGLADECVEPLPMIERVGALGIGKWAARRIDEDDDHGRNGARINERVERGLDIRGPAPEVIAGRRLVENGIVPRSGGVVARRRIEGHVDRGGGAALPGGGHARYRNVTRAAREPREPWLR